MPTATANAPERAEAECETYPDATKARAQPGQPACDENELELLDLAFPDQFFAQPKYRIASSRPGSGNTKNIGSVIKIAELVNGTGPFSWLGEEVYDDYWMFYLTRDMAQTLSIERPYTNLKTYLEYKKRGVDALRAHEQEIIQLAEDEAGKAGEESE